MSRNLQRGFAAAALVLLVALAIAAKILQPESKAPDGSVDSAEPEGRKALLLLLRGLGFDAEAWREAPELLASERGLLWLPCVPPRTGPVSARVPASTKGDRDQGRKGAPDEKEAKDASDEREAKDASGEKDAEDASGEEGMEGDRSEAAVSPARAGAFGLAHYADFVRSGGVLVVAAGKETRTFLVEDLGIPASAIPPLAESADAGVRTFTDGSEELSIDVRKAGVFVSRLPGFPARPVVWARAGDGRGEDVLAAEIPLGAGRIVLLGDDGFLANEKIGEHDHALLAARLADALAPASGPSSSPASATSTGGDRRVLFDEYALGTWQPETPVAILASPRFFLATLHALLLLGLVVLRAAWAREFPRDPLTQRTTSPLLRARALGGLLARAGRFDVLSRFLLEGAARGVERRDPRAARTLRERAARPAGSARELEGLASEVRAIERGTG